MTLEIQSNPSDSYAARGITDNRLQFVVAAAVYANFSGVREGRVRPPLRGQHLDPYSGVCQRGVRAVVEDRTVTTDRQREIPCGA